MVKILATDKQIDTIEGMSERLGIKEKYNFNEMTIQQASDIITGLYEQRGTKKGKRRVTTEEIIEESLGSFDGVRLGLCMKLVYQKFADAYGDVEVNKAEFKRAVVTLYKIFVEIEEGK